MPTHRSRLIATLLTLALLSAGLCFGGGVLAQKPVGATQTGPNPRLPTLFIIGDSTVNNSTKGQMGWGTPIAAFFNKSKINFENRARGGRSSRTYLTEGLWDRVLAE